MTGTETNRDRLLECIEQHPDGLDDDQLAEMSGVKPRQQVYQIATRLEGEGLIKREAVTKPGKRRKIHNYPLGHSNLQVTRAPDHPAATIPLWKKRLSALVAATGRDEADILDEALREFAHELLKDGMQ